MSLRHKTTSVRHGAISLLHREGDMAAILTVRGKDHDLDAAELDKLGDAMKAAAVLARSAAKSEQPGEVTP